ncbi:MAG: hypothetical protein HY917_04080 [Candidatus Diapherotrites archaeon]|nr:hypothetical protein [Candidatus Diapherotrites archaeon]
MAPRPQKPVSLRIEPPSDEALHSMVQTAIRQQVPLNATHWQQSTEPRPFLPNKASLNTLYQLIEGRKRIQPENGKPEKFMGHGGFEEYLRTHHGVPFQEIQKNRKNTFFEKEADIHTQVHDLLNEGVNPASVAWTPARFVSPKKGRAPDPVRQQMAVLYRAVLKRKFFGYKSWDDYLMSHHRVPFAEINRNLKMKFYENDAEIMNGILKIIENPNVPFNADAWNHKTTHTETAVPPDLRTRMRKLYMAAWERKYFGKKDWAELIEPYLTPRIFSKMTVTGGTFIKKYFGIGRTPVSINQIAREHKTTPVTVTRYIQQALNAISPEERHILLKNSQNR